MTCGGCWQIYNISGLRAFRDGLVGEDFREMRDWLSYQLTPRAEIFRRDHSKAHDLAGMQRLMRSNTFLSPDKVGHACQSHESWRCSMRDTAHGI